MNDKNELLDDSWEGGPCSKKSVKRKLPIQVALEYIKLNCRKKRTQMSYDISLDEVDAGVVSDGDGPRLPPTTETGKYTFTIENTPKHPVQLMVCVVHKRWTVTN